MSKFTDFFKPRRLGFHLLLAIGVTVILMIIVSVCLKFYTRHDSEMNMPNFVGQNADVLIKDSLSQDFIIVISDYIYDADVAENIILKQNPLPDEKVKKGRKVYITVSSQVPPKVKMPPLQDVSLRQAEIMLDALDLKIEKVIYKPSDYENAVLEQLYKGREIVPGTDISVGEAITLVVGKNVNDLPASDSTDTSEEPIPLE